MASALAGAQRDRWRSRGVRPLDPGGALTGLGAMLAAAAAGPCLVYADLDWAALAGALPGAASASFRDLAAAAGAAAAGAGRIPAADAGSGDLLALLGSAPAAERRRRLLAELGREVRRALGMGEGPALGPATAFFTLGMDSLMALELRNRLQARLGRAWPTSLVLDHPSLEQLADYLAGELWPPAPPPPAGLDPAGLSTEELAGLLMDRMARLQVERRE
jgi:hypothetical protein